MASCSADTVGSEQTQRYSYRFAPRGVITPLAQGLAEKRQRWQEHQHGSGRQPLGSPELNERFASAAGHDDGRARVSATRCRHMPAPSSDPPAVPHATVRPGDLLSTPRWRRESPRSAHRSRCPVVSRARRGSRRRSRSDSRWTRGAGPTHARSTQEMWRRPHAQLRAPDARLDLISDVLPGTFVRRTASMPFASAGKLTARRTPSGIRPTSQRSAHWNTGIVRRYPRRRPRTHRRGRSLQATRRCALPAQGTPTGFGRVRPRSVRQHEGGWRASGAQHERCVAGQGSRSPEAMLSSSGSRWEACWERGIR
jgi:hypothetical protein